ncbi:hypothetical protein [Brevibacillus sp. SYSU BS000544]|uniref:hypothetical protein n=1 Tax=Brevibacillus sp. SYSU BS000544 TaxID=3416443 RepID=UPI003CE4C589
MMKTAGRWLATLALVVIAAYGLPAYADGSGDKPVYTHKRSTYKYQVPNRESVPAIGQHNSHYVLACEGEGLSIGEWKLYGNPDYPGNAYYMVQVSYKRGVMFENGYNRNYNVLDFQPDYYETTSGEFFVKYEDRNRVQLCAQYDLMAIHEAEETYRDGELIYSAGAPRAIYFLAEGGGKAIRTIITDN